MSSGKLEEDRMSNLTERPIFRSAGEAKKTPSGTREHLCTSLSWSRTSRDGCAPSIYVKLAASKVQVTVNAESQTTAPQKSTMFLASSVEDSKCVARETSGPICIDAHTRKEPTESASLAPTSEVLSSGLYATAVEGPATQAMKSEVSEEAPTFKNEENGEVDLLPPTEGAAQTENRLDDAQGEVAILPDLLVVSKQASGPHYVENMETALNLGPAAEHSASRQLVRSPPPEVQAGAVESPPSSVPVAIISGNCLLLIAACLLILLFVIAVIAAIVTRQDGARETTEHTSCSFVTTTRSKAPAVSGVYLCKTEACLREGAYLNSLLSGDIRPCTNFYQYVCERWLPERAAANATSKTFGSRDTIIEAQMETKFVKSVTSNPEYVRPVQALLQACNDRPLASSAMTELRKLFHQWNMDEWPLPPYATRSREDVWILAGDLLRDLGLAAIVDVFSARDPSDDRGILVAVDSPEPLYFPRGDVAGSQIVRAALKEVLHLFDVVDALSVDRFASDVIRVFGVLETLYQPVIHDEAEVLHLSEIDAGFGKLIKRATRGNKTTAEHQENARVLVLDPKFTNALPGYLGLVPTPAILNYLIFRAFVRLAAFLPDSMSSLRRLSYVESAGRFEKPEVLSLCLRTLERAAPICFLRALAQPPSSMAALRRHWLSDLESVLHRALPRIRWLDALSRAAVAERLRLLRIDASFIGSPKSAGPCAAADVRVLRAPMTALVEIFRRRPLQSITSWWRRALPLSTWPSLDLPSGYLVHLPPGLINDSVPANGSLLFAFHLARVAVRLYAAMMPILYAGSLYDRSLPLTDMSESRTRTLLACLDLGEWHQWAAPLGSNRDSWLRRWLLDQTLALELALLSFRKLSAADRVWELDTRFANLAEVTSTQLFFVYYALDHCERRDAEEAGNEHAHRELLLRRRLPSSAMVNLPLRNMPAFAKAFECVPGDYLRANWSCLLFQQ
ncbi:hypothetical protein HPB51_026256 [Rhipicephalus microplus]|uniref:M13 family peptidase n=1 Tax=Rhipicephalus microplus TaxID=6941 RepID=A0A9J6D7W1_RHIMP|nr:hypothetical protein HPB51_026256 [Rhipicephalus microplus]